ncbi:hypothetical protein FACS1894189_5250 [Planctomycetales bacterium]|nr:hypothetical protein FACS1894189_5250 [Planctomycetales bacterium]
MKKRHITGSFLLSLTLLIVPLYAQTPDDTPKKFTQEQLETFATLPSRNNPGIKLLMESLCPPKTTNIGGNEIKYRLHVPEQMEPGKKYPLVLWLHGAGEDGIDNNKQLINIHHVIPYLTGEKKRDFFLFLPQTPGGWHASSASSVVAVPKKMVEVYLNNKNEETADTIRTMLGLANGTNFTVELQDDDIAIIRAESQSDNSPLGTAFAVIDKLVEEYPVDKDRITVSGLSSGGDGTWRALEARPELFAAAVPLVSWSALRADQIKMSPVLKKIPIWAIYSSDDNGIDRARADFERVEKAGCNVKKTEFGICGHNAWTPAMLQADIFSYLLSRAKKDNEYVAVADANVNPDDLKGITEVATRDPGKPKLAPAAPVGGLVPLGVLQKPESRTEIRTVTFPGQEVVIDEIIQRTPAGETVRRVPRKITGEPAGRRPSQIITETLTQSTRPSIDPKKDALYSKLAEQYLQTNSLEGIDRCIGKLSPDRRYVLIDRLISRTNNPAALGLLEKWIDQIPSTVQHPARIQYHPAQVPSAPVAVVPEEVCQQAVKIVEDCDRPWAMTSESMYGMFPADWNKEAQKVPDFVVNSTADNLAKKLAASVSKDGADFTAACRSILDLENKPLSSPWFETGGGRLRSDIKYSLSEKGQMFVRLLKTVKDSGDTDEKKARAKIAAKTLEKIETILE